LIRDFDIKLFDSQGLLVSDVSGGLSGNSRFTPRDLACGFVGQDGQAMRWVANPSRGITLIDNPNYAQHFSITVRQAPRPSTCAGSRVAEPR